MTDPLHVYCDVTDDGIQVRFRDKPYPIVYPKGIWKATPAQTRLALKDNLALATTMHLPIVFSVPVIIYHSGLPLLEPYFVQNFLKDITSCTEVDGTSTDEVVRKFFNAEYRFLDSTIVNP